MARSRAFWDQVHMAFDPGEILVGQRSRDLYCEREDSPLELMRGCLRPGLDLARPPIVFFTGHRGSGKSSMLWRLMEGLAEDYFLVYFDIQHNLDAARANQIDLLYLLGATIFQVAVDEGLEPDAGLLAELADAVSSLTVTRKEPSKDESLDIVKLAQNLICFGASAMGASFGEKLARAVLEPFNLSSGVSDETVRKREIEPQVQKIVNSVNVLIADVRTRADREVLVVVDGLDKLPRLDQAKLIFLESGALRGPVCHLVYTVPMSVYMDLAFGQAEEECRSFLLPNVKVYEKKSGRKYGAGHAMLREVVAKRLRTLEMEVADLFAPEALERLIRKSGGILRWLILLVRDACMFTEAAGVDKVSREAAARAITHHAGKLTFRLNASLVEELRQVRETKLPTGSDTSAELLQSLMIVAYFNGEPWFDAHPLVWEALGE